MSAALEDAVADAKRRLDAVPSARPKQQARIEVTRDGARLIKLELVRESGERVPLPPITGLTYSHPAQGHGDVALAFPAHLVRFLDA